MDSGLDVVMELKALANALEMYRYKLMREGHALRDAAVEGLSVRDSRCIRTCIGECILWMFK